MYAEIIQWHIYLLPKALYEQLQMHGYEDLQTYRLSSP